MCCKWFQLQEGHHPMGLFCNFDWGSEAGSAGDLATMAGQCAAHVATSRAASVGCYNYGYSADKGHAAVFVLSWPS